MKLAGSDGLQSPCHGDLRGKRTRIYIQCDGLVAAGCQRVTLRLKKSWHCRKSLADTDCSKPTGEGKYKEDVFMEGGERCLEHYVRNFPK